MIRAVLDTNVVVSALLTPSGVTASLLNLAALHAFRCYVSRPILDEYREVLGRDHLGIAEREVITSIARLQPSAVLLTPRRRLQVCRDPGDNKFLECALEGRADYLVTGNLRHFPKQFQDIRIVLPKAFLTVLYSELR